MQRLLWLALAAMLVPQELPRAIEIWSTDPIAIDIEWITIDDAGKQTVTAIRKTVAGPPMPLEFMHGPGRFVRFSYQGASPRTYSTAELLSAKKLHVPDVLPGGELLLIVPQMPVRPVQLLIQGPRAKTITLGSAAHASLPGVPAGLYRISPIYEGGIHGQAQRATVADATTTLLPMPAEDLGAVRVTAPDDVCGPATEMGIDGLVYADVGVNFRTPPNRKRIITSTEPRCVMTFAGLKPGTFEAAYRSGRMPLGAGEFVIAAQATSAVEVIGRRVIVEGRATLNGKPLSGLAVAFALSGKDRTGSAITTQVTTDTAGSYRATLERPGEYAVIAIRSRLRMPAREPVHLVEGRNIHDIAIIGGTIRVDLIGWQPGTSVQIRMEGRDSSGTSTSMSSSMFASPPKDPIAFEGLTFGEYRIAVTSARPDRTRPMSRDMSNAKTVILTAASPEATVSFDVTKR